MRANSADTPEEGGWFNSESKMALKSILEWYLDKKAVKHSDFLHGCERMHDIHLLQLIQARTITKAKASNVSEPNTLENVSELF